MLNPFFSSLLLHLISTVTAARHSLCTTASLTVRGMDVVAASKGTVLVAVFMPLQCASCHRQLKRLSYMSSNLADVRVVVVAPYYEAPVTIARTQSEFPRLIVDRDVSNTWRTYDATNHDKIVFDRCGRVTQILSHPRSDMTANRDTLDAIDRARGHSPCGPCSTAAQADDRLRKTAKSVDAFLKTTVVQQRQQPSNDHYFNGQNIRLNAPFNGRQNNEDNHQQVDNTRRNVQMQKQNTPSQEYDNARYYQATTAFPLRNQEMNVNSQQPKSRHSSNALYGGRHKSSYQSSRSNSFGHLTYLSEESPLPSRRAATGVSPQPTTPYVYGPDEDYEDDVLLSTIQTTPFLQTQIPSPTPFDPRWPTPAPGHFYMSDPRNQQRDESKFTAFGEQASENNIPCSAYTDDICYQQQENFGRAGLSKCCKKGIYLTDVCLPGKCSNHTTQLCCFQKFLQARYRCCEDDNQSLGPSSTSDFNKCCYDHFVNEDVCCNMKLAARYWKTVHELCYPNTKVDYSGIKLEVIHGIATDSNRIVFQVRFVEGMRVVDLNERRIWEYECRNGVNRTQYAYIP
ncbi:hypothetical protein Angca_001500 [Angiostrongylus cantonensis]|nr:hypothetical protein Angca_001500 [Angiostrongylus cantonensis]